MKLKSAKGRTAVRAPKFDKALAAQLTTHLEAIRDWQDNLQGQAEACRAALIHLFQHVQADEVLRARVESGLAGWMQLMKSNGDPQATIAGFELAMKGLLGAFHAGNPADVKH